MEVDRASGKAVEVDQASGKVVEADRASAKVVEVTEIVEAVVLHVVGVVVEVEAEGVVVGVLKVERT